MAVKKTELYSSLWASCDTLRGGMDASQYKDYVLTLLFMKYVTDKFLGQAYADITVFDKENDPEEDSEKRTGCSFKDFIALKNNKNIGEGMDKIIARLAQVNPKLKGIIDNAHFNDEAKIGKYKEMVDKLTELVSIFQRDELDFSKNHAGGDDIIGDAYEYLMRNFATESGKSKGQFYTPAEVSRILAKVIGIDKCTNPYAEVYDPACGSGSLLIRALNESPYDTVAGYGQEKDGTTAGLAIMNAVLHDYATVNIKSDNTFSKPMFKKKDDDTILKRFDYIVANPPFSTKNWTNGLEEFGRFDGYGDRPPESNGDFAWLLHILKSLKSSGKAAVILPHGVLFRGNAEATIRQHIIDKGYIKGIISLPANLFYGTGIPACIIIIDKEGAENREGIFMVDASKGYVKDGNKNRLREQDIYKIVTTFNNEIVTDKKYARFVPNLEIKKTNEYNLNISRYIDSSEQEDLQSIEAHLNGGIPDVDVDGLEKYWNVFTKLKDTLLTLYRDGYYKLNIDKDNIRQTVYADAEFSHYGEKVDEAFSAWKEFAYPKLTTLSNTSDDKTLILELSEKLIELFEPLTLLNKYDVYQVLLAFWNETMNDDVSLVIADGYDTVKLTENIISKSKNKKKEVVEKIIGWDGVIIPKPIIINHFFTKEKNAIEDVQIIIEETTSRFDEIIENAEEETFIFENKDLAKSKLKTASQARKKEIKSDKTLITEYNQLKALIELITRESEQSKILKVMEAELDTKARSQYEKLTDTEIIDLLVNQKWFNSINQGLEELYAAISHRMTNRIIELAERYEDTLPTLTASVNDYEIKVKAHLERMGFKW